MEVPQFGTGRVSRPGTDPTVTRPTVSVALSSPLRGAARRNHRPVAPRNSATRPRRSVGRPIAVARSVARRRPMESTQQRWFVVVG